MTFEEFQATRAWSDHLPASINDARWENEPGPIRGNVYLGCLYIEKVLLPQGEWSLVIGRVQRISDDLAALERDLYEFAKAEGYA